MNKMNPDCSQSGLPIFMSIKNRNSSVRRYNFSIQTFPSYDTSDSFGKKSVPDRRDGFAPWPATAAPCLPKPWERMPKAWENMPNLWANCPRGWEKMLRTWESCPKVWASMPGPWASFPKLWGDIPNRWAIVPKRRASFPKGPPGFPKAGESLFGRRRNCCVIRGCSTEARSGPINP